MCTLKAITIFRLFTDDIEDRIDQFSPLSVMSLGPVIAGPVLAEDEVVRPKDPSVWPGAQTVHSPRLEVHQHRPGDIAAPACLVVVHIYSLELNMGVASVVPHGIDAMLLAHDLPELAADLVSALAGLDMEDFSHLEQDELGEMGILQKENVVWNEIGGVQGWPFVGARR